MNCPRCVTSSMTEVVRDDVTIDRCDRCRGIWLDRGELEKLIARDVERVEGASAQLDSLDRREDDRDRRRHVGNDDDDDDDRARRGRRSWWSLFD